MEQSQGHHILRGQNDPRKAQSQHGVLDRSFAMGGDPCVLYHSPSLVQCWGPLDVCCHLLGTPWPLGAATLGLRGIVGGQWAVTPASAVCRPSDVTRQEGRPAWGCVVLPHGTGEGEADLRHMKRVFICEKTETGFHLGSHRDSREKALPRRLWWLEVCWGQLALRWMFCRGLMFLCHLLQAPGE